MLVERNISHLETLNNFRRTHHIRMTLLKEDKERKTGKCSFLDLKSEMSTH